MNPKNTTTIGIRAEIDVLPIQEKTTHSYKSINQGKMHACGHDTHIAMLLGTCKILNSMKGKFNVNVKFLFQSAEETLGGPKLLVQDKCLENPKVDYMFGLHVMKTLYFNQKNNLD